MYGPDFREINYREGERCLYVCGRAACTATDRFSLLVGILEYRLFFLYLFVYSLTGNSRKLFDMKIK